MKHGQELSQLMRFPTCPHTKVIIHHSKCSAASKYAGKSNVGEWQYKGLNLQTILGIQEAFLKLSSMRTLTVLYFWNIFAFRCLRTNYNSTEIFPTIMVHFIKLEFNSTFSHCAGSYPWTVPPLLEPHLLSELFFYIIQQCDFYII